MNRDMPANPHAADYAASEASSDGAAISAATMALAYEQRTANLLAYGQLGFLDDLLTDVLQRRLGLLTEPEPECANCGGLAGGHFAGCLIEDQCRECFAIGGHDVSCSRADA